MTNQEQSVLEQVRITMAGLASDIKHIREKVDRIPGEYVTQAEFRPIRALVYGAVGLVLTGVVGAILALVVKS